MGTSGFNRIVSFTVLILTVSLLRCSVQNIALEKVSDMFSSGTGEVFSNDNDPELIKEALPFALKLYESLLQSLPEDDDLLLATGKAFCMYSYAFVQGPADTLSDKAIDLKTKKYKRAEKLYMRGYRYLRRALEVRHPDFIEYYDSKKYDSALDLCTERDTTLLYWTANSFMGAYTTNKFNLAMGMKVKGAVSMMKEVMKYNESFNNGAVHNFFISYYGNMPKSMGGSNKLAREHFKRSVEISGGRNPAPYLALATSVSVSEKKPDEFKSLLRKATDIDPEKKSGNRLEVIIAQDKASWMLENIDNYFLIKNRASE
ncbi:MAG: TRAP transporter TatT component family protein [Chitinivibrionales bacterium]